MSLSNAPLHSSTGVDFRNTVVPCSTRAVTGHLEHRGDATWFHHPFLDMSIAQLIGPSKGEMRGALPESWQKIRDLTKCLGLPGSPETSCTSEGWDSRFCRHSSSYAGPAWSLSGLQCRKIRGPPRPSKGVPSTLIGFI